MNDEDDHSIALLSEAVRTGDPDLVQDAVFEFEHYWSKRCWRTKPLPDQVVESVLDVLRDPQLDDSQSAAFVLTFFEYRSKNLTEAQKKRVLGFLATHGERFTHIHSRQVIAELREGDSLT